MDEYRWVSCAKDVNYSVGLDRHLLGRGREQITTLCGATGMPSDVWRGNTKKPQCKECVKEAQRRGIKWPR